jgi:hypothetical protein
VPIAIDDSYIYIYEAAAAAAAADYYLCHRSLAGK